MTILNRRLLLSFNIRFNQFIKTVKWAFTNKAHRLPCCVHPGTLQTPPCMWPICTAGLWCKASTTLLQAQSSEGRGAAQRPVPTAATGPQTAYHTARVWPANPLPPSSASSHPPPERPLVYPCTDALSLGLIRITESAACCSSALKSEVIIGVYFMVCVF